MDAADRAQGEQEAELEAHLKAQRERARLEASGSELCADCAEPIDLERRRAVPSATRCISCQAWAERFDTYKKNGRTP